MSRMKQRRLAALEAKKGPESTWFTDLLPFLTLAEMEEIEVVLEAFAEDFGDQPVPVEHYVAHLAPDLGAKIAAAANGQFPTELAGRRPPATSIPTTGDDQ